MNRNPVASSECPIYVLTIAFGDIEIDHVLQACRFSTSEGYPPFDIRCSLSTIVGKDAPHSAECKLYIQLHV